MIGRGEGGPLPEGGPAAPIRVLSITKMLLFPAIRPSPFSPHKTPTCGKGIASHHQDTAIVR